MERVVDWCIVLPDGEEIGNVTGKAMDALGVGAVGFVIEMKPVGERFASFKVVRVLNPKTQQQVPEIVRGDVVARVEAEAVRRFSKLKVTDDKAKYQFILTSFPQWEILSP